MDSLVPLPLTPCGHQHWPRVVAGDFSGAVGSVGSAEGKAPQTGNSQCKSMEGTKPAEGDGQLEYHAKGLPQGAWRLVCCREWQEHVKRSPPEPILTLA